MEKLASLATIPVSRWSTLQAERLPGEPPLYRIPVDDTWRLFVQVEKGQKPEVMDIARRELLELFAKGTKSSN